MNLDQFVAWAQGQPPLLYPPNPEKYRGQCYQLINFYIDKVWHTPLIWRLNAYELLKGAEAAGYQVIYNNPNDPNQLPPRGAVVVFSKDLPGSGGSGHTDVFLQSYGAGVWIGLDANWGGKVAHKVTHNWSYVAGWFYPKASTPVPAPAPQGGDEMIRNEAEARLAYGLLRPGGQVSDGEIAGTAGKRTWLQFANDGQTEVRQRDQHISEMQGAINSQNQTITDLTTKLTSSEATAQEKQAALSEALQKIATDNAEMTTLHDKITEYDANPVIKAQNQAAELAKKPSRAAVVLAAFINSFTKFKRAQKK